MDLITNTTKPKTDPAKQYLMNSASGKAINPITGLPTTSSTQTNTPVSTSTKSTPSTGALEDQGYGSAKDVTSQTSAIMSGYMTQPEAQTNQQISNVVSQQKAGTISDDEVDKQVASIQSQAATNNAATVNQTGANQTLNFADELSAETIDAIKKSYEMWQSQQANASGTKARGGETTGTTDISGTQTGATGTVADMTGTQYATSQNQGAYSGAMDLAEQSLLASQQLANAKYIASEESRRMQMANSLSQTDAGQRAAANGENLASWTMQELEQLWATEMGDLSKENKDRIRAGRRPELDMLAITRNLGMAENEYQKRTVERTYGRAITDREEYNARQDAKSERLLAAYGGGKVSSLASNVAVMEAQEKRQRDLEYIRSEYVDKATLVSDKANYIIDNYDIQSRKIEQEIIGKQEEAFLKVSDTLDELMAGGVKNISTLQESLAESIQEYSKTYTDLVDKQLSYELDLNKQMFDEMESFKKYILDVDKTYSDMTGVIYQNGAPMLDALGNQINTADFTQNATDNDIKLMLGTGMFFKNGSMILGADNKPLQVPLGLMDEISYSSSESKIKLDQMGLTLDQWKAMDSSQRAWFQAYINKNQEARLSEESEFEASLPESPGDTTFNNASGAGDIVDTSLTSFYGNPVKAAPQMAEKLEKANELLGGNLKITDSYRSTAAQAQSYMSGKEGVAPPGTSFHEKGLAVDLEQTADMNNEKVFSVLKSLGLKQHPGEWWHWSMGEFS